MEWGIAEITQILLYVLGLGVPTAWLTGWLYRMWRKANMPSILAALKRQRRRDAKIKATGERTDALETFQNEAVRRLSEMENRLRNSERKVGNMETAISQLRKKLRSRGLITDA